MRVHPSKTTKKKKKMGDGGGGGVVTQTTPWKAKKVLKNFNLVKSAKKKIELFDYNFYVYTQNSTIFRSSASL